MKLMTPVVSRTVALISILVITGCGSGNWERMSIEGATVRFEMPKPIKMTENPQDGMVLYVGQKPAEKLSFKVGIVKRNYEQDQAKGVSDQEVLRNFAQRIIEGSQKQFQQMGLQARFQFAGDLKVDTGNGMQVDGQVGKATVINRFYINKQGIYWVEAVTQDVKNKDINRFLASFKP
jgi:hypothetical protein